MLYKSQKKVAIQKNVLFSKLSISVQARIIQNFHQSLVKVKSRWTQKFNDLILMTKKVVIA